jgi:hypothetical protein
MIRKLLFIISGRATHGLKELFSMKTIKGSNYNLPDPLGRTPLPPYKPLSSLPSSLGPDDGSSDAITSAKVTIVGTDTAGLFTTIILDYFNNDETLKNMGVKVSYDTFEASDRKSIGGRLLTYNFVAQGARNLPGPK